MSAVSWNAESSSSSPIVAAPAIEKKSFILNQLGGAKRVVAVCPASQLEVRPRPEMITTGIAELDALTGGLPRGCLSEICGPASCGKSSVLLAAMGAATRRGEICVLIDSSDSFDPESGAAAALDFAKFLWVRCGRFFNHKERRVTQAFPKGAEYRLEQVLKSTDLILQSGGFGLVALDLAGVPEKYVRRIPLASWFRFQRAVEHTKTVLLVISEFACAQTCASVVLKLSAQPSAIGREPSGKSLDLHILPPDVCKARAHTGGASEILRTEPSHTQLLEKVQIEAELARTRLERKPMRSAHAKFTTRAVRAG